jgi:glycosyltransferase involved in cell wall biosynthesis
MDFGGSLITVSDSSVTTKTSPLVSVIIPAYKVAPFIRETLESVFAQDLQDFEVIVVNDGSPDTAELEVAIGPFLPRINYLKQANLGAGAARNAGLRVASGTYVGFLDGDDIWLPTFLSEQIQLLKTGGFDLVYADSVNFGNSKAAGTRHMALNPSSGEATFEALITARCSVLTSTVLARRDLIVKVGLFDESLPNSQDFDLWVRLVRDGNARINYQDKVLGRRRLYPGSLASDSLKSLRGEITVLKKLSGRKDLSQSEIATIAGTLAMREALADKTIGKRNLRAGDYAAAYRSFESANRVLRSWKLRIAMWGLRLAPAVMRRASRERSD